MNNAAVFLDRDGTLNFDPGYLKRAEDFRFLPGVKTALKKLAAQGLKLFVISNQSGIGRGLITRADVQRIHKKMTAELKESGVILQEILVCPHRPDAGCGCRKPSPKLIRQAARRHKLNLWNSFVVGDKLTDVETGVRAGLQTVLLSSTKMSQGVIQPDHVSKNMAGAARWILRRHSILSKEPS